MLIYMVTNKINGKKYIGQTVKKLHERKSGHKCEIKYDRTNMVIHKAIKKYGWDNFEWQVLWEGKENPDDPFYLDRMERRYMNEYKPEYNMREGGQNGYRHSEETKRKISESIKNKKGIHTTYMITIGGETLIINDLRKWCNDNGYNYNSMIRVANGWSNQHKGIKCEHCNHELKLNAQQNIKNRNQPSGYSLKSVNGHRLMKDNIVYEFDHIKNFCIEHDLSRSAIGLVLKGKRKSHKGFILP